MSIFNKIDPRRLADEALNGIVRPAAEGIRRSFEQLGGKLEGTLRSVADECVKGIHNAAGTVQNEIKKAGENAITEIQRTAETATTEAEKTFTDKVPQLFESALHAAIAKALEAAIKKTVNILRTAAPSEIEVDIGPLTLSCGDLTDRIETIEALAKKTPGSADDVKTLIKAFSPTSVEIDLSAGLAAVFVQSSSLEVGTKMSWETEDFLNKLDKIWDAL